MKCLLKNGTEIEFDDTGSGKVVVLIHAFPLSRAMWQPQIESLRGEFRVIAPDLRGFGGTTVFGEPPTMERMADDVNALLDERDVSEPVVVCGLSMGGYVALAFARKYAARLRGLVLADTRAEPDDEAGKAGRKKMIAFAAEHSPREVIDHVMPKMVSGAAFKNQTPVVEQVRALASAQSREGIIHALRAMRDRPDSRPTLAQIKAPTLVIVGGDDTLTPPPMAQTLASGIRGARLVTIKGAGHISNLENPDAFTRAMREFLGGLP